MVEVDIVFEKVFWVPRNPWAVYSQGTEKDYMIVIGPMTRALVKRIDTLL